MDATAEGARLIETIRRPFKFTANPPGSKSETNRAYVLAALASGVSHVRRPLRAADPDLLLAALVSCGAQSHAHEGAVSITGVGGRPRGGSGISLGDGGTPARFMIAVASLARGDTVVDGSPRMRERPVKEGVDLLRSLGARIDYASSSEGLPVLVKGGLAGGSIMVARTASSQFVSAMMLVAPWTERGIDIYFSEPPTSPSYIELSVEALRRFGAEVTVLRDGAGRLARIAVPGVPLEAHDVIIEPDASSAVYFLAAAALVKDARVTVAGLSRSTRQPDGALVGALVAMGAGEIPCASGICVEGGAHLKGIDIDASRFPDGALCLGALAAAAKGTTRIRGLETLRSKESNRVAVLATELSKLGCGVKTTDSTIEIDPSSAHGRAVTIDCHNDHRVAMSFAILGLVRPGVTIGDPACVGKSYPGFWGELTRMQSSVDGS